MSKEQKALERIAKALVKNIKNSHRLEFIDEVIKNNDIQTLLDKIIPLKPYIQMMTSQLEGIDSFRTAIYEWTCAKCDTTIEDDFAFCPYCGQALDWSDS